MQEAGTSASYVEVIEGLLAKMTRQPIHWQFSLRELFHLHVIFVFLYYQWNFLANEDIFFTNFVFNKKGNNKKKKKNQINIFKGLVVWNRAIVKKKKAF